MMLASVLAASPREALQPAEEADLKKCPPGCRGQAFSDPHIKTLSGEDFFMHGVGVYDYASVGDITTQVYICPSAACTESMLQAGDCKTFVSAVAVKTPRHTAIMRGSHLEVDGKEHFGGYQDLQELTVNAVGALRVGHRDVNKRVD